ncbi:ERF family protein [Mesorhizobium sp.]|uniref:ERF family protein n=1 Tax=Mesorhizobium sp. TaxID=1871066 RepID=UPI0025C6CCF4|nr:ERF family protein [Mesorhizobium sp.]
MRKYATLNAVMTFLRPILENNGFSLVHTTLANGRGAALETILLHTSGEYISSTIDVPLFKNNDPQAYGSGLTYGRRYSIMALLGLTAQEEDDDAQAAMTTLQERLSDLFSAQTIEELNSARMRHETAVGLEKVDVWAIKAVIKVMSEKFQ